MHFKPAHSILHLIFLMNSHQQTSRHCDCLHFVFFCECVATTSIVACWCMQSAVSLCYLSLFFNRITFGLSPIIPNMRIMTAFLQLNGITYTVLWCCFTFLPSQQYIGKIALQWTHTFTWGHDNELLTVRLAIIPLETRVVLLDLWSAGMCAHVRGSISFYIL